MSLVALDRILGLFWIEVLRHLWQTALVVLPLFLVAFVLRSAPARWSHRLWVAALVKLLVPLAVFGPLAGAALQRLRATAAVPTPEAAGGFRVLVTFIGAGPEVRVGSAAAWFPAPFWTLCTVTYIAIAGWLIVRLGRDLVAANRLGRAGSPLEDGLRARLDSAIARAGLSKDLVRVSASNVTPSVVGVFRPRIVLPVQLLQILNVDELAAVLLHEEMHRRNGDTALSLAQRVISSVLFFFPLIGPMQRRLREAAEARCDEETLRAGAHPHAYVRALACTIRLGLEPSPSPAALGDGHPSLIAKRLARLGEAPHETTKLAHRLAIAAAAVVLATGVFLPVGPKKLAAGDDSATPDFDRLWNRDASITLSFDDAPAATVLEAIAKAASINLSVEGPEDCCPVTVSLVGIPLRQALELVAAQTDLRYAVTDSDTVIATLQSPSLPTEDVTMPKLITKVDPIYPDDARQARIGGKVILQAVIRKDGSVGEIQVLSNDSGLTSLAESAVTSARQRTYSPAMKQGRPVSIYFTIKVEFRLR